MRGQSELWTRESWRLGGRDLEGRDRPVWVGRAGQRPSSRPGAGRGGNRASEEKGWLSETEYRIGL